MNKLLPVIALATVGNLVSAQIPLGVSPSSIAREFYNTPYWAQAFAASYGVQSGVEPGLPDAASDKGERELLGKIRVHLQEGSDASLALGLTEIENFFRTPAKGATAAPVAHPMLLQIAGTIAMRLGEVTRVEAEAKRYQQLAETYLRRAIDPNGGFPNFLRVHKNLANLLFRGGRPNDAKPHFIKAIELGDREAVTFGLLGAIYLEEGKLIASETSLRQALMVSPDILEFKQLLGNNLMQQERWNEAKELFAELLQRRPNEVNFWMAQANCFVALEMIDEATTNLEIVRFMGKANAPSLMLLGDVYMNRNMVEDATLVYLDALKTDSNTSTVSTYLRAAETLNNFAAYDHAMRMLDGIEKTYGSRLPDKDQISLLTLRSEVNIALGKGDEAADNLESILRRDPLNARALLSLARYYSSKQADDNVTDEQERIRVLRQNQNRAILYYERAQNLDDDNDRVRALIGDAQLRVRREELEKAVELLQEAQRIKYSDSVNAYLNQVQAAARARRRS
jgi:tetratricopeptide (TPR) repeat protein